MSSSSQSTLDNFLKLKRLVDSATTKLQALFKQKWIDQTGKEWHNTDGDRLKLIGKVGCSKEQVQLITDGDTSKWDVTLLTSLLTSSHFNLPASDIAQLHKLRKVRNAISHHASMHIEFDDFNKHWADLESILVWLGEDRDSLELLKFSSDLGRSPLPLNQSTQQEVDRMRTEANDLFKAAKYDDAIRAYSEAIVLPGLGSQDLLKFYANRSAAHLKLHQQRKNNKTSSKHLLGAMEDAKTSRDLWPEWWRPHFRIAQVHHQSENWQKAIKSYEQVVVLDPANQEVKNPLSECRRKLGESERRDSEDHHVRSLQDKQAAEAFKNKSGIDATNPKELQAMLKKIEKYDPALANCVRGHSARMLKIMPKLPSYTRNLLIKDVLMQCIH